jgi:hypothetical protein
MNKSFYFTKRLGVTMNKPIPAWWCIRLVEEMSVSVNNYNPAGQCGDRKSVPWAAKA